MPELQEADVGPRPIAEPIRAVLQNVHLRILATATDEVLRDEATEYLQNECGLTTAEIAGLLENMEAA